MQPDKGSGPHVSAGAATRTAAKRSAPILPDRGESDEAFALRVCLNPQLWDAYLVGYQYGYVEGHAEGYAAIVADIDRAAARVADNVISDRSRRWGVTQ